jgi:hypothetical protein
MKTKKEFAAKPSEAQSSAKSGMKNLVKDLKLEKWMKGEGYAGKGLKQRMAIFTMLIVV